jgi:hypothetical protein
MRLAKIFAVPGYSLLDCIGKRVLRPGGIDRT